MGRELPQPSPGESTGDEPAVKRSGCPFGHSATAPHPARSDEMRVATEAPAGVCPLGFGRASAEGPQENTESSGGRCPFGYDTPSNKASLTPLHCMLCESLLYNCVAAQPCMHRFCRFCITPFRDCPACGRDVDELKDDTAYQGEVDKFVQTHVERPIQLVTDEPAPAQANRMTPAAFLLELGLTSFAGRNFEAALHWLGDCKEQLLKAAEASGGDDAAYTKLGAVSGSQGDCCRQMGNAQAAAEHYHESIRHLHEASNASSEASQAVPVSLNKLGDLQYWQGDVQGAREWYIQALQDRQRLLSAASSEDQQSPDHLARLIDVGVSLGKVMDADKALGDEPAANQHRAEALHLVQVASQDIRRTSPAVQKKFEALQQLLQNPMQG